MGDPLWYKEAVIYQLHVKAFCDSNGDGIGDFKGLLDRIEYFQKLGVTALWLLPFYPSPLRDDGYDISNYVEIHPSYGTLADFREFLDAAHRSGLRVISELVLNHTSDQHPWFERARRAPRGSTEREFYVWNNTPDRYADARIIFKDFEVSNWSWDRTANAYYWHRFYSHQPDLNFENRAVINALFEAIDFWLEMGVDGLRLDAVPYLFEREGTNCENLPETHEFLRELRAHIDGKFEDRMLLAEANQWPEDATAYFGKGDECHMEFHFPLMPRMFMALQMEDRFPIIDILDQSPEIPDNCQWAIFLRNHDELTLEMVTDEERDYMYRVYAEDPRARINLGIRRRLAPLLRNSRRRIELIHSLLFSLPGTPILYYGDEIGMGDNFYLGDRNGVRTPMQWSPDRNAGFSRANPQELYLPVIIDPEYHYETVNVETQENNPSSLFWWIRRLIAIRRRNRALSDGRIEFLRPENSSVLAYLRIFEDETVLAIANLSRFAQCITLDLSAHAGKVPVELFSHTPWPAIDMHPRMFTLGPHNFLWLSLMTIHDTPSLPESVIPELRVPSLPDSVDQPLLRLAEKECMVPFLQRMRWFGGKNRTIREASIQDSLPLQASKNAARILVVQVSFVDGDSEYYQIGAQIARDAAADAILKNHPEAVLGNLLGPGGERAILFDAVFDIEARRSILQQIATQTVTRGNNHTLAGERGRALREEDEQLFSSSRLGGAEQSNTSVLVDKSYFLKLYRKLEAGTNPDVELTRYLSEVRGFQNIPGFAGRLTLRTNGRESVAGLLVTFTENQGDGWTYSLDAVARFAERVLAGPRQFDPALLTGMIGAVYPERVRQLARRTGEMHLALAGDDPAYAPEAFGTLYQRSLYQALRGNARRTLELLQRLEPTLAEQDHEFASWLISSEPEILKMHARLMERRIDAAKIRIHGDFHLGQVLNTGNDFVIIDFEGEPRRPMSERRLKRCPLVDVAGMLRSFDYASQVVLRAQAEPDLQLLRPWMRAWAKWVSDLFVSEYRDILLSSQLVPRDPADFNKLLETFLLDKALYEVGYELTYRPPMVGIPLKAISELLRESPQ